MSLPILQSTIIVRYTLTSIYLNLPPKYTVRSFCICFVLVNIPTFILAKGGSLYNYLNISL